MAMSRRTALTAGAALAATTALPLLGAPAQAHTDRPPHGEELCGRSASELLHLMRTRRVSPVEVMQAHLARIHRLNTALTAFVFLLPDEQVLAAARDAERRYRTGTARALEGLPLAVKDLFDYLAGVPNTFGSVPFQRMGFTPPFSSIYIQRLLDAGAIPVGKTNTPEFGHMIATDNLAYGPTRSPFDLAENAGGSSGGSAAAVAAGLVPLAQGSDAGGSVRAPAARTNTVGFKATYGRVPEDAPPLSHTPMLAPGPITRTVTDAALMLDVMARPWSADPFSLPDTLQFLRGLTGDIRGRKVAWCPDLDIFPVEPAVAATVEQALAAFRAAGAHVRRVPVGLHDVKVKTRMATSGERPATQADLSALWVMQQSVLYAHGRTLFPYEGIPVDLLGPGIREELSPELVEMIERGEAVTATEYRFGDFLRIAVNAAFETVLAEYDYIVCPTVATVSLPNGRDRDTLGPATVNGVAVDRLIGSALTYPLNFSGHPAVSVPAGLCGHLPVGMQIIGRRWADVELLNAARAVELHRPWIGNYPRL